MESQNASKNNEVVFESINCNLCGSNQYELVLKGNDKLYNLPGEFLIVKCLHCGLKFVNPRPTMESIILYYPDNYEPHLLTSSHNKISLFTININKIMKKLPNVVQGILKTIKRYMLSIKALLIRKIEAIIDTYAKKLPIFEKPGTVLEIGCATGEYLNMLRNEGWNTYGVEFVEAPATRARNVYGLNVIQGTVESMNFPNNYFDLIIGWMVLEHLYNPLLSLKKINKSLKNNGCFAFDIPNIDSLEFKIFKQNWYALHLPNHLYHYSLNSINHMLKKAGFKINNVIYQREINDLIMSFGYVLKDIFGENKLSNLLFSLKRKRPIWLLLLLNPIMRLLALTKQSSRFTIWAQKIW